MILEKRKGMNLMSNPANCTLGKKRFFIKIYINASKIKISSEVLIKRGFVSSNPADS